METWLRGKIALTVIWKFPAITPMYASVTCMEKKNIRL